MNHSRLPVDRHGKFARGAAMLCLTLLCMSLTVFSAATEAGAGPPGSPAAPAWTANPALVAQLGPEVKIVTPGLGTYGIRPPRGFQLRQVNMTAIAGGSLFYVWQGPMKPDRTAANFLVTIERDNSGAFPGMNSASFVRLEMSSMTRSHSHSQASAIQTGAIHGLPFAYASWKGVGPRTGKPFAGFFYGQFVRPRAIIIEAKDESPASQTSLPIFRAAALTLHKL